MLDYKTLQNSGLLPLGVWSLNYTAGHNTFGDQMEYSARGMA